MELVLSQQKLLLGKSYIRGIFTIFPNLFWETHPGSKYLGEASSWYLPTLLSENAIEQGRGLGYHMLAEAYFNFGGAGIVLVPLLIGFALGRLTNWGEFENPAKLAMMASVGAFILQVPRGFWAGPARPFVWYALIPYLLTNFRIKPTKRWSAG